MPNSLSYIRGMIKETVEIYGWVVDIRCPKNADQAYKNEVARELIEMKMNGELEDYQY